jgi:hypothetical protein
MCGVLRAARQCGRRDPRRITLASDGADLPAARAAVAASRHSDERGAHGPRTWRWRDGPASRTCRSCRTITAGGRGDRESLPLRDLVGGRSRTRTWNLFLIRDRQCLSGSSRVRCRPNELAAVGPETRSRRHGGWSSEGRLELRQRQLAPGSSRRLRAPAARPRHSRAERRERSTHTKSDLVAAGRRPATGSACGADRVPSPAPSNRHQTFRLP